MSEIIHGIIFAGIVFLLLFIFIYESKKFNSRPEIDLER